MFSFVVVIGVVRAEAFLMASNTLYLRCFGADVYAFTMNLSSYAAPRYLAALTPISGVRAASCLFVI
jgi:hypothetical protein